MQPPTAEDVLFRFFIRGRQELGVFSVMARKLRI
jgi:hypothetical protein